MTVYVRVIVQQVVIEPATGEWTPLRQTVSEPYKIRQPLRLLRKDTRLHAQDTVIQLLPYVRGSV